MILWNERQQAILDLLAQQGKLKANDIVDNFGVSIATAYRDLNQLVEAGLAIKIQGGIILASSSSASGHQPGCSQCGQPVSSRLSFHLQLLDGEQLIACCPHCGLLLLGQHSHAQAAMATDFLYLNKISVSQAIFLVNSGLIVCCSPSVLCFASQDDAERFRKGFGGQPLGYADARDHVRAMMSLHHVG